MPVAEALGIAGSVIAIVQISKTVISMCHFYIEAVSGESSDLRAILIEVSMLKAIAESLEYLTQPKVATTALLEQLAAVTGPIEGCKKLLKDLELLFPSDKLVTSPKHLKWHKFDTAAAVLAWPLKRGKAKKLLEEIMQHKATISLTLTTEFVHDLKAVKQTAEKIQNLVTDEQRGNICRWTETTNPSPIHNRSQHLYEPGTGSWILRTPEWSSWIERKHRCLWVNGIPGAGKSILASYVAEEVQKYCKSNPEGSARLGHAYYYCYFGHNQDESTHFLRWIIGQLCRQSLTVPEELQEVYNSGKVPTLSCLLSILHSLIKEFKHIYIVLDALDESMPREDLLRIVRDLCTDARFTSLSLLVTSRLYVDIEQVLEPFSTPVTMSNSYVEDDIATLVKSTVRSDPRYQRWPEESLLEMQSLIPKRAKGMFRWAVCQLELLKKSKPDVSSIHIALMNLPKSLDETYERIFLSIPEDDWQSVRHVFHWMMYHTELFQESIPVGVLLQALQHCSKDLLPDGADQLHDFEGLRESCGCLITIEQQVDRSGVLDVRVVGKWETVSFAHYTVREYLESPRTSLRKVGFFAVSMQNIQNQYAEIVLRQALFLQPGDVTDLPFSEQKDKSHVLDLFGKNFRLYCAVASCVQMCWWSQAISSHSTLVDLSETLVDPHSSINASLTRLLYSVPDALGIRSVCNHVTVALKLKWLERPNSAAATFLAFVRMAGYGMPHLAVAFAKKHSMLLILMQHQHFEQRKCKDPLTDMIGITFSFEGCIPEIAAQHAEVDEETFIFILDLITECGSTHFDLSTLVLFCIQKHQHRYRSSPCIIKRLLCMGADPNGPARCYVSPLQIAVACWDLECVRLLLDAGADVNALGRGDFEWSHKSPMAKFNGLHSVSPLYIIRTIIPGADPPCRFHGRNEATHRLVEAKLLEHGAIEIGPDL